VIRTRGNRYAHVVLRGGSTPNYDSLSIRQCENELAANQLPENIMVDCSHANSSRNYALQPNVLRDCVQQILNGNQSIIGFMIESNLGAGNQSIPVDRTQLKYGISVTDPCIDWPTTETILREARGKLKGGRQKT
jgi:3-deoxy-7-phosphoheptulonate synthase